MDNQLIGIFGKKHSGKDTCSKYLIDTYNYKRYAVEDPITKTLCDFNDDNGQKLKNNWGDENEIIRMKLFKMWYKENPVVITDVRFQHEIDAIKSLGGIIVKITRDNNLEDTHISEETIEEKMIYYNLDNNYTKVDLYSQIDTLINLLNLDKK
jgi:hypothetical protein